MKTFREYVAMQEGLWLNDKNAVVGLSRTAPPTPPKKVKPPSPPRIIPVNAPAPPASVGSIQDPVVDTQFPDAVTMLARLGISLVEPSKDQMRRLVDRAKKQVIIPQPLQKSPKWGKSQAKP